MHNKNEKTKPKVSSIKRKQKKQNQKVVLENEKEKANQKLVLHSTTLKFLNSEKTKKTNGKKQMEKNGKIFEKITFRKTQDYYYIEASKNGE